MLVKLTTCYQNFTSSFCANIFLTKNYKAKLTVSGEKLHKTLLSFDKSAHKMLVKLIIGLNFSNIFTRSSHVHRSQKHKKTVISVFLCFWDLFE